MLVSDETADFLRRPLGTKLSCNCSAAARRSAALGARRVLTAASLRELTGLRAAGLEVVAVLRDVGASARAAPLLRLPDVPSDFAAAERTAGLFAVRMVRAAVLVPVLRVVPASLRLVARAAVVDFGERVVAGLVARTGVLRVLVDALARLAGARVAAVLVAAVLVAAVLVEGVRVDAARAAGARVDAARAGAARVPARAAERPPTFRFAGAALFARVVLTAAAFVPVFGPGFAPALAPIALPRVAGARLAGARLAGARLVAAPAVLARDVAALATRGDFGAALAGLGPGFFAAADRVPAAVPVRVVRVVAARALVPAVRRPPARIAMARVRPLSELSSLLITGILFRLSEMECLRDTASVVGRLGCSKEGSYDTEADVADRTKQHPGVTSGTTAQRLGDLPKTGSALSST